MTDDYKERDNTFTGKIQQGDRRAEVGDSPRSHRDGGAVGCAFGLAGVVEPLSAFATGMALAASLA